MTQYMKVPVERIAVIIGPGGKTKRDIEKRIKTEFTVDSSNGNIEFPEGGDPIQKMRTVDVLKAIGRGFSPEKAITLFDDEMLMLDIIDLSESTSTQKEQKRIKGRIIGRGGKTREIMEKLIGVHISVYGKTVSFIGTPEQNQIVRTAIDMLINGVNHGTVYNYLEKKHQDIMKRQIQDTYRNIEFVDDEKEDEDTQDDDGVQEDVNDTQESIDDMQEDIDN
ncbi:MAG: RNA-processing protein [Methanosarcinaceae archaeon]|nr:RNA-processing protein [Methanosarcinaceae archaeon]